MLPKEAVVGSRSLHVEDESIEMSAKETATATRAEQEPLKVPKEAVIKSRSSHVEDESIEMSAKEMAAATRAKLRMYEIPLQNPDVAMVMQGWNKVLAFKESFSEAMMIRWRLEIALAEIEEEASEDRDGNLDSRMAKQAMDQVENNTDPLAIAMAIRIYDLEDLIMRLLDAGVRSLCPHLQTVQREAYRPIEDNHVLEQARGEIGPLESIAIEDIFRLFARRGVNPNYWYHFVQAFTWCMKTHVPYAQDDDHEEFDKLDNAFLRAITQTVALPAIACFTKSMEFLRTDVFTLGVPRFWNRINEEARAGFGEEFYKTLLVKNPDLMDYFSRTNLDALSLHLMATIDVLVKSINELGRSNTSFRNAVDNLGEHHRKLGIPTYTYAMIGNHLLDCLAPLFQLEEQITKNDKYPVKASQLLKAWATLYTEVASLMNYPMLHQTNLIDQATEFYNNVAEELGWSGRELKQRLLEITYEIASTGTYNQTTQEIETGARLAWRNSAKCVGRISWKTLEIRDKRHVTDPHEMFREVEEHLKLATAGTSIQSIMTIFAPKGPKQIFGTRFWSSQFVRYAAYNDLIDEPILGDPANLELTEYLINRKLWTPPKLKTAFDVLPLVLKVPGKACPLVHRLPQAVIFEVPIEHPTRPEINALGYRWTTVPAISNFKMNLGGVIYGNMPFNGWFMTTEIVRNLMERYDAGPAVAKAIGIDMATNPFWKQLVALELEVAVNSSFGKNGYTIVDPHTAGNQFCAHVRREREHGRECPGQWSWIGGLVGPTNPTWHLEMRDFLILPQYSYCADDMKLHTDLGDNTLDVSASGTEDTDSISSYSEYSLSRSIVPHVLIVYGSETGNAESVARRIKSRCHLLKPTLKSLDEVVARNSRSAARLITHVICVCSTFGKGKPPSNACKFFESELPAKVADGVSGAKFAVLALGSTIYPDFCAAGVALDAKLERCGLERLCPIAKADEAAGADEAISAFVDLVSKLLLPPELERELQAMQDSFCYDPPVHTFKWYGDVDMDRTRWSDDEKLECLSNEELLNDPETASSRSIRKVTFKLPKGTCYETGDHVCVNPMNSGALIKRFLKLFEHELVLDVANPLANDTSSEKSLSFMANNLFGLECIQEDEISPADVFFVTPTTLNDVLKNYLDLSLSSRNISDLVKTMKRFLQELFDSLEGRSMEENEAVETSELVLEFLEIATQLDDAPDTKDAIIARFPTVVGLLEHFKPLFLDDFTTKELGWNSSKPLLTLPEVLVCLPRLQPRYYSISSSNQANADEVSITVGVLTTTTSAGAIIEGVCSHHLAGLEPGIDRAKLSISKSTFRLPADTTAPLIMVGAGTGLAPMMGFLQDRYQAKQAGATLGPIYLFFGCRTESDIIYKDLLTKYQEEGLIDLRLALSRPADGENKYVQHKLAEMKEDLCGLLNDPGTHYYVCGDARMAASCFEACVQVLREFGPTSRVWAVQNLTRLRVQGRWQSDVWGIVTHFEESKKVLEKRRKGAAKIWLKRLRGEDDDDS